LGLSCKEAEGVRGYLTKLNYGMSKVCYGGSLGCYEQGQKILEDYAEANCISPEFDETVELAENIFQFSTLLFAAKSGKGLNQNFKPAVVPLSAKKATKAKALKVMKKYNPPCFKPGKALKKRFNNNPKKLEKEFYKQLKGQQDGINKMTVGKYLENRETLTGLVKEHGHKKARQILTNGGAAQADARTKLVKKITKSASKSYFNQGMSRSEAKKMAVEKAAKTLKELAALHDPDMIAGGDDKIRRLGNKNVNSSLGSQWAKESRVSNIDKAAKQAMANSGADTKMNVELTRCK
jgi:hypothetical protein